MRLVIRFKEGCQALGVEKERTSEKSRAKRSRSTEDIGESLPSDLVRFSIDGLVRDGFATWRRLETGDVELHVVTGEIFLFGGTTITRIA